MADIITPYTGVTPKRTLSQAAFNSAMEEFLPFLETLPVEVNYAISHIIGLADALWYNASTIYNPTGSTKPDFVYGSDGITYVCIGANVAGDNPVGSVAGNWAALTALANTGSGDGVPIGATIMWDTETPPTGYLERNGGEISRATYSELYAVIGTTFGVGNGSTTFNLPSNCGEFPRAWDHGAGVDLDAASRTDRGDGTVGDHMGTKQGWQIQSHNHPQKGGAYPAQVGGASNFTGTTSGATLPYSTGSTGGNQTNPVNFNTMFCIKAFEA